MFYKVDNSFYINSDKISTIEFTKEGFANISFGDCTDEAISAELAKQIMDDMGCASFNPYDIVGDIEDEQENDKQGENVESDHLCGVVKQDDEMTFAELAEHAYALGFRYVTKLNEEHPHTTVFWVDKPTYNKETKTWELDGIGNAFIINTKAVIGGLVELAVYLEAFAIYV